MTTAPAAGTRVTVTVPSGPPAVIRLGQTRMHVTEWTGTVLGPVAWEPGMTRVRRDGCDQAVRTLTEYLTVIPA